MWYKRRFLQGTEFSMGKKNRKRDDYWDTQFEEDLDMMAKPEEDSKEANEPLENGQPAPQPSSKKKKNKKQTPSTEKKANPEPHQNNAEVKEVEKVTEQVKQVSVSEKTTKKKGKKLPAGLAMLKEQLAIQKAAEEEQRKIEEEEQRKAEERRKQVEEEERLAEEAKQKKKERLKAKKDRMKKSGKLLSKADRERAAMNRIKLEQMQQMRQSRDSPQTEEVEKVELVQKTEVVVTKSISVPKTGDTENLRSPICCILGHVDTGKTKLLDKIRQTNVQEGEAGGITQQIGATYFPIEVIEEKTKDLEKTEKYDVPGLLVIDTPGHESFTNLRSRGSSLCNIAILVVDIMHGLEPQTLESIGLLRQRKTPFVVALNKIDRLYDWKPYPNMPFEYSLSKQTKNVQREFMDRVSKTKVAFAEQGLNAELSYLNDDVRKYVSLIPTSAHSGEGIPDLLNLIIRLTQSMMSKSLKYLSGLECTVLEVKVIEGLGTTVDVIVSNGMLHEGDRIVLCGLNGPIVTNIRALLTPEPLKEMRVKSNYVHHKQVKAALGVKICAADMEKALAGSQLMVVGPDDDEEEVMERVMGDLNQLLSSIDKSGIGVCVQASTLGSLEALLQFLKDSNIPVSGVSIGPVHKKDVIRASVMLDRAKEYAVMLCFDVKIDRDAQELAEELGIPVFKADIIYHLFDQFTAYMANINEQKKKDLAPKVVFPCILKIVPNCIFNKKDPIVLGVQVTEGVLRIGTPLCVTNRVDGKLEVTTLGKVTSIEHNHKAIDKAVKGSSVAIKIECASYETGKMFGRHFQESDEIVSKISRASIDILKENFRNELSKEEWQLVVKLKKLLEIQ